MSCPVFHFLKQLIVTIFLTCDGVHLVLRCLGVARDLIGRREREAGVQVQAQHEIMHLATGLLWIWIQQKCNKNAAGAHKVFCMKCYIMLNEQWTYQVTFPARPSLVLNKDESLKSDVNMRWTQLAWAVRLNSSSASWFSVPAEHQNNENIVKSNVVAKNLTVAQKINPFL